MLGVCAMGKQKLSRTQIKKFKKWRKVIKKFGKAIPRTRRLFDVEEAAKPRPVRHIAPPLTVGAHVDFLFVEEKKIDDLRKVE
jgi:hypothetical protein